MLIRPRHLSPGETIGIIAPASAPPDPQAIDRATTALEKLGYRTKLARHVHKRRGYLAGTDRERAADLMQMFGDRRVQAIVCVRGGYGTARLLPLLDYKIIRQNAKVFVGYSDITSLHCAFHTSASLISFHGPMLNSDFAHANIPPFTVDSLVRTVSCPPYESTPSQRDISLGYPDETVAVLRRGVARGKLIGGNLSVLSTLVGTPWLPSFKSRILFLEDVGEQPYRFDRMLTHLLNCGLLQQVAGIAVGLNADCEDPKSKATRDYRQTLMDVLRERLLPLKVPVISGLPFGHVPHNATIPFGVEAILDANRGLLSLTEPCVR